ncbi:(d)CMP kinase [Desulfatitalea alkaliphila]|uniref:Cytidylate kinase n=1 Tax=Desulfatitalea alkaliphila TaxID=2929485 RepID=A0AA41UPU7_9BACT|nr:(d)CMP kinase [Desulfatitalea alkaliphila]MCJ8500803.1 (d)CMP kinase [Desulfatitalea alkaliphila]
MDSTNQRPSRLVVTIDGPAGSGKTTVSKMLAHRLGYRYLDTGALYRAVAVAAQQGGVDPADGAALAQLCQGIDLDLQEGGDGLRVLLNGEDITGRLRAPAISLLASTISARPVVRRFLLTTQRSIGAQKGLVAEGRDMGTVVFPEAEAKFFLDADPHVRACRRYEELQAGGDGPSLDSVEEQMVQRDRNDTTRSVAPLKPAVDSLRIDATHLTPEQVIARMMTHIESKR